MHISKTLRRYATNGLVVVLILASFHRINIPVSAAEQSVAAPNPLTRSASNSYRSPVRELTREVRRIDQVSRQIVDDGINVVTAAYSNENVASTRAARSPIARTASEQKEELVTFGHSSFLAASQPLRDFASGHEQQTGPIAQSSRVAERTVAFPAAQTNSNPELILPTDAGPSNIEQQENVDTEAMGDKPINKLLWWEERLAAEILKGRRPLKMTLQSALGLALTQAPELQVLHSEWYIQQTEAERLSAAFDWTTFVESIWNRDSTPVGSDLDGAARRLRSRGLNSSTGMRRLTRDGTEIEVSQSFSTLNSNSRFINPNNQANSRLAIQLEKPLLRGAGENYNTQQIQLAEIRKESAFDRFQIGVQDHLLDVATAYWRLVLRRGRFLQAVNSWQRSKDIATEMETRTEIDVTPTMLNRARAEVSMRLSSAIEAEHDIIRSQDSLLRLIYGAHFTDFTDFEILTTSLPMRKSCDVHPRAQIEKAIQTRSEIHQAIREIKGASVQFDVASNEVLPALNMVLNGYVAGLHGGNDIGGSFLRQFSEGEPGVGIGFNFEIPYRNRAAQAAAEQSVIAIKRMQAQFQATVGLVAEDVRNQIIQRNKFGTILTQQEDALRRASRILRMTQERRRELGGKDVADLYLENLLQMQGRLEDAEFTYLQSQVQYTLADNGLSRAVSSLDKIANTVIEANAPCQTCEPNGYAGGHSLDIQQTPAIAPVSQVKPIQ